MRNCSAFVTWHRPVSWDNDWKSVVRIISQSIKLHLALIILWVHKKLVYGTTHSFTPKYVLCNLFKISKQRKVLTKANNDSIFPPFFNTPVFRRDVLWYGDVRPGLRPTLRPSVRPSGSPSARFPHFSPTCFDILSWNFAQDFVLMYYRSSLSVVILRQFLKELCLFLNLEYRKYTVFHTFLLHALTYWAEIVHTTLF